MTGRGGRDMFGDVTGEYLALRTGAAVVWPWHDLVWVRGRDAVSFLDGLVSQAVDRLAPGEVARSLLLAPQGKLRALLVVLAGGDDQGGGEVGLLADVGMGQRVIDDLSRFRLRVDATLEPDPGPVVEVWGPGSAAAVADVTGAQPPPAAGGWMRSPDGVVVAAVPFRHVELARYVVAGVDPDRFSALPRAGRLAVDAVRIEAGEPVMDVDVDDKTIPAEGGVVEGSVAFDKGCFLGQELVARIDSRGRVNRHLRGLRLTGNVLPPLEASVTGEGRDLGRLSSLAESLTLRAPVGLGLLRREAGPGDTVTISWEGGSVEAVVGALPLDDFT